MKGLITLVAYHDTEVVAVPVSNSADLILSIRRIYRTDYGTKQKKPKFCKKKNEFIFSVTFGE